MFRSHMQSCGPIQSTLATLQASGSPVRKSSASHKGSSTTAGVAQALRPARAAASAKQQPKSPVVLDLCSSPPAPAKLATASDNAEKGSGGMQAAAASEPTDQVEMVDVSQSPIKHTGGSSAPKAAASGQSQLRGEKSPMLDLAMGAAMSGSADPYWQRLSDLIVQGGIGSEHAEELRQVFAEEHQDKWGGRVPAHLLSGKCHSTVYDHSYQQGAIGDL